MKSPFGYLLGTTEREYAVSTVAMADAMSFAGYQFHERKARHFSWLHFNPTATDLPDFVWKLHLAFRPDEAVEFISALNSYLPSTHAHGKIPSSLSGVAAINNGFAGETQIGKTATLYHSTEEELHQAVDWWSARWRRTEPLRPVFDVPVIDAQRLGIRYGVARSVGAGFDSLGRPFQALPLPGSPPDERDPANAMLSYNLLSNRSRYRRPSDDVDDDTSEILGRFLKLCYLQKTPRQWVCLGLDLHTARTVIIKRARPGVGCDSTGRDSASRLAIECSNLRALQSFKRSPRLICQDEDLSLCVLSDVHGDQFLPVNAGRFLSAFPTLLECVRQLHLFGWAHRDLKPENLILGDAGLHLIDFELACPIGSIGTVSGTPHYIPPEGPEAPATIAYDVYSLGLTLASIFLGRSIEQLPIDDVRGRVLRLLSAANAGPILSIVQRATDPDPRRRPTVSDMQESMNAAASSTASAQLNQVPSPRRQSGQTRCDTQLAASAVTEALSFAVRTRDGLRWRNQHLHSDYLVDGLNIGASGILIGLCKAVQSAGPDDRWMRHIEETADMLAQSTSLLNSPGLFTGCGGVALGLAHAAALLGRSDLYNVSIDRLIRSLRQFESGSNPDLFSGGAGALLCASLLVGLNKSDLNADQTRIDALSDLAEVIAADLEFRLESPDYALLRADPAFDDQERVYVGCAHGVVGTILGLCSWRIARTGEASAGHRHWTAIADRIAGNWESAVPETIDGRIRDQHTWCHGLTGVMWAGALLSRLSGESCYINVLDDLRLTSHWSKTIPWITDSTICHGAAGIVETIRLLSDFSDEPALSEAWFKARTLLGCLRMAEGKNVWWPSESHLEKTPDLWVGFLGPAVQLLMCTHNVRGSIIEPWLTLPRNSGLPLQARISEPVCDAAFVKQET